MSLQSVGGTITTVVGLGITLGALGLAFEFADRAFDSTRDGKRRARRRPLFDTSLGNSGRRRRRNDNIFDPIGQPRRRSGGRRKKQTAFGGDFF